MQVQYPTTAGQAVDAYGNPVNPAGASTYPPSTSYTGKKTRIFKFHHWTLLYLYKREIKIYNNRK